MLAMLLLVSLLGGNFQGIVYAAEDTFDEQETLDELSDDELDLNPESDEGEELRTFGIEYELYDGENHPDNPDTYVEGTEIVLNEPQKEGYWFKGWYLDWKLKEKIRIISADMKGNIKLYAKWVPIEYTITYHLNGGNNNNRNPQSYYIESSEITLRKPVRIGYDFLGWYLEETFENQITIIPEKGLGDYELFAKWELSSYKLTYSMGEGAINSEINPEEYQITSPLIVFDVPTRNGYTFLGWYLDSNYKTAITQLEEGSFGNKLLYAKWTPTKYKIHYELNGGKNNSKNPKEYDITTKTITLNSGSKTGYTFEGWFTDSEFVNAITTVPQGSTGDLTLYAGWNLIQYQLKYEGIEEKDILLNPEFYDVETETFYLKEPTKEGYVFVGWYSDKNYKNEVKSIPKGTSGNKTLYARWAAEEYTIKFHGNGATKGSMDSIENCKYDKKCSLPKNEYKRLWYTFTGWNTQKNGKGRSISDKDSVKELIADEKGVVTLYAQWAKKFNKKGVDVSEYQGTINWSKVKNDGVSFAMLRIVKGDTGSMKVDDKFESNYKDARNAGINVGVYRYTYAKTTSEAKREAEKVLQVLNGRDLDYPVVLDIEDQSLLEGGISTSTRTSIVLAFKKVIEEAGYEFAVYANKNWFDNYLDMSRLADVDLWIARWRSVDEGHGYSGKGNVVMWQYTDHGRVSGISGYVDMNISY